MASTPFSEDISLGRNPCNEYKEFSYVLEVKLDRLKVSDICKENILFDKGSFFESKLKEFKFSRINEDKF